MMKDWVPDSSLIAVAGALLLGQLKLTKTPGTNAQPPAVQFAGRWYANQRAPHQPKANWPGSSIRARFNGTRVTVALTVTNNGATPQKTVYLMAVVDGGRPARIAVVPSAAVQSIPIRSGLASGAHEVEVSLESGGNLDVVQFVSFDFGLGGALLAPPARKALQMEVIGDSITCGLGNLGVFGTPSCDPTVDPNALSAAESSYMAYGSVAARMLGADLSTVCASGHGIHEASGGQLDTLDNPEMPELYQYALEPHITGVTRPAPLLPFPAPAPAPAQPPADLVVVNLGTNDLLGNARNNLKSTGVAAALPLPSPLFETSYAMGPTATGAPGLLAAIRAKNPAAQIILTFGSLITDRTFANDPGVVQGYRAELAHIIQLHKARTGDEKIHQVTLTPQSGALGYGCMRHPTWKQDAAMAAELVQGIHAAIGTPVLHASDPNPYPSP